VASKLKNNSGKLSCDGNVLSYRHETGGWSLAVSDIRLVAEYTTSDGPWSDDYFLAFIRARQPTHHETSFYADGRDDALRQLGQALGTVLRLGLCNSADFKSRIIWPTYLADKPLFDLAPSRTTMGRFRQRWLGAPIDTVLSEAAQSAIKE
jgi:hypothetical protein